MSVVGLDQSYTGFGYSADGGAKKKGFPATKYPHPRLRLLAIEGWLEEWLISVEPIDLVVREGYAPGAKFGREVAGELGWAVDRTVYNVTNRWPLVVPPPSLKKFVTGKGNAKKNEMLLGVYKQWGHSFADDNVADAYSLEQFGKAYLYLKEGKDPDAFPLYKYQVEAIQAVRDQA